MWVKEADGQVTLNAEGRRYVASFHVGRDEMTVTSGSVSRVIWIGPVVVEPASVARTVLRSMVADSTREGCGTLACREGRAS